MNRSLLLVLCLALIVSSTHSLMPLYKVLRLSSYLMDLVKINVTGPFYGPNTTLFRKDPNLLTYLYQFDNRTHYCNHKCPRIWEIQCFALFGCNIQTRNFLLIFVAPLLLLVITGSCCGKGVWTIPCWCRYLFYFSGLGVLVWGIGKLWRVICRKK